MALIRFAIRSKVVVPAGARSVRLRAPFGFLAASLFGLVVLATAAVHAAPFAYISGFSTNNVTVIDTATNTITTTIPVGQGPIGVAVSPDGTRVYVANYTSSTVSIISTASNSVIGTVPVGPGPIPIAVTPDSARVYVGNKGDNSVSVISTATNTVIATIVLGTPPGTYPGPEGVAITPDGAFVYVTVAQRDSVVSVISTASNTVVATIPIGSLSTPKSPKGIAVTPDGARVYVAFSSSIFGVNGAVYVISTASNTVTATVDMGFGLIASNQIAVTPDGARVYVTNPYNLGSHPFSVSVISTATNAVTATISLPFGSDPEGIAVTPDGSKVYVANGFLDTVFVIGTAGNNVSATVALAKGSYALSPGLFITPGAPQVTTRMVVPGGTSTTTKSTPGAGVSFEVRIDAPAAKTIGSAYRISQTTPASPSSFFTVTGRSVLGSPFDDTNFGTSDAIVLALPSAQLNPDNDNNLGEASAGLVGISAANNILAQTITLTSDPATPLGTYRIQPTPGVSFVTDDAFKDYDMSNAFFDIVVGQTLSVTKAGTGTGTVSADSGAINCGATCSDFYVGTKVTLTAAPSGGSTFAGWSGGGCSGTGTCVVTINAAISVTATFNLNVLSFALGVSKTGTGSGTVTSVDTFINCGGTCSASYVNGSMATLMAAPSGGSVFAGWSGGGCSGTGTCVVTVNATTNVTATFNLNGLSVALTVAKAGNGTGTVTSADTFINCGATCSATYASGAAVVLTAAPDTGQSFTGWSGGGCSGTGTCSVTINAPLTVTATFADTTPPDTTITGHPTDRSSDMNPVFTFISTEAGSTFQCALDSATFAACTPPWQTHVVAGPHTFQVRAIDAAANVDPTPASYAWTVVTSVASNVPIPALSGWMLALLAVVLGAMGLAAKRRRW